MAVWTPILVPAAIAGLCLFVSWRLWRGRGVSPRGHWGGAAAFAGAYFAGHVLLLGWPAMPPVSSAEWQAWLALALGIAGAGQRWWGGRWYMAWPVRVALAVGVCLALLQGPLKHEWGQREGLIWLAGVCAALVASWSSLERLTVIRAGASIPLGLAVYCSISAAVLFLAGAASLGQLAGALAAASGAAVLLAWWAPGLRFDGGAMTAFAPLLSGLLIRSYFLSDLSAWVGALLYFAPFALWYGERRRFQFGRPWKAALVRAGLVGLPAGLALGVQWWLSSRGEGGLY